MDKKKVIARIEQLRIEKGISVYQLKRMRIYLRLYINGRKTRRETETELRH